MMPMHHMTALSAIKPILEANPDVILINEGANTLDDTRDAVNMSLPRHRVDCATWQSWEWGWLRNRCRRSHRQIRSGNRG